jgi:uncharacterized protein with PIN domain
MSEQSSAVPLNQLRARFASQAMAAFDRMFGADGQNGLVTFDQREQRACEVTDGLARWLMAEHVGRDERAGPVEAACPLCGGPVRYESGAQAERERREFETRRGKIEYQRVACRCPRCRKIFFPAG